MPDATRPRPSSIPVNVNEGFRPIPKLNVGIQTSLRTARKQSERLIQGVSVRRAFNPTTTGSRSPAKAVGLHRFVLLGPPVTFSCLWSLLECYDTRNMVERGEADFGRELQVAIEKIAGRNIQER